MNKLYFDGNNLGISWIINNCGTILKQNRIHPEIYLNQLTQVQSKFVALHIGIFWGVGTFTIKNKNDLDIMIYSKDMHEHLLKNIEINDVFIIKRTEFINKLIKQRELNVRYYLKKDINPATNLLDSIK